MTVTRPLLRWHGGKWRIAPWVIAHLPPHRCYVEPFGGAASVLLRKPRCYAEVWNDLDGTLVELFRVLRDPVQSLELVRQLELTPFARDEFTAAYIPTGDPVESARRTVTRSFMGFGSDSTAGHYRTGFRGNTTKMGTTPARDWATFPDALRAAIERLRGVTFENQPAAAVMARYDGPETLHYVDPPYMAATRGTGNRRRCGPGTEAWHVYRHELSDSDHRALLEQLLELDGMVVLAGYPTKLYDDMLGGWRRVQRKAWADGARARTEVMWLNPRASAGAEQLTLAAA